MMQLKAVTAVSSMMLATAILFLKSSNPVTSFDILSSVHRASTTKRSVELSEGWSTSQRLTRSSPSILRESWQLSASTISSEASDSRSAATNSDSSHNYNLPFDWKTVVDHVWESSSRPIVLFDGHCNLCNGAVCFCLDWDTSARFRFASLQSKVGQSLLLQTGRSPYDLSSIVLVTSPTKSYRESDAVLRICQKLQGPVWPVLGVLGLGVPRLVRDAAYKVVAKNRHRFMEDMCRIDLDGEYHDRFVHDEDHVVVDNVGVVSGDAKDSFATKTTTTTTTK